MAIVKDLLSTKPQHVHTIQESASLVEAANKMTSNQIGCLVVVRDEASVRGIIAERDLVRWIAAAREDLSTHAVCEAMTTEVIVCTPEDSLDSVRSIMKTQRVRQVPVVDEGKLQGIISMGDANAYLIAEEAVELKFLHDYIDGTVR